MKDKNKMPNCWICEDEGLVYYYKKKIMLIIKWQLVVDVKKG